MTGRITVVIATRDRRDQLTRTLDHLRALRPRPPVIVLDNGSTDGTAGTVRARYPDVELVALRRNEGAAARNLGVAGARTPYVAFSDDDSWWEPGALPLAERVLDEHPGVGLIAATPVVNPRGEPDPVARLMAASPLGRPDGLPGPAVLGFLACASVVRRDAYLAVGGFSRLLHFAAEEKLLAYDLAAAGWQLCHVDGVRARHHPSPGRPGEHRRMLEERNRLLISWLRRPRRTALTHTADVLRRAATDPLARKAFGQAARRLPTALAQRRELPSRLEQQVRLLEREHGH
ncbi:glycosyltransferase family 2 protein [Amycolatopsis suaedae]|uniref:Glycosyltransferase n=1 Tax=Amycolatopsis suaedae TaxID=2510978 RepID=A0A4Q7IYZ6_9PSEU|nr:glycosyltransferase [Amycolatopsis suaedae]RZQ60230.1 glycosyltransferase [Amycolatopsis suaedae]